MSSVSHKINTFTKGVKNVVTSKGIQLAIEVLGEKSTMHTKVNFY